MKVWIVTRQPDEGWADIVMVCSSEKKAITRAKRELAHTGDFIDIDETFLNSTWSRQSPAWGEYLAALPCDWSEPGHAVGCACNRCASHRRNCGKHGTES